MFGYTISWITQHDLNLGSSIYAPALAKKKRKKSSSKLWAGGGQTNGGVPPSVPTKAARECGALRQHLSAPNDSPIGSTGEEENKQDLCHDSDESHRLGLLCGAKSRQTDRSMETIRVHSNQPSASYYVLTT